MGCPKDKYIANNKGIKSKAQSGLQESVVIANPNKV